MYGEGIQVYINLCLRCSMVVVSFRLYRSLKKRKILYKDIGNHSNFKFKSYEIFLYLIILYSQTSRLEILIIELTIYSLTTQSP